MRCLIMRGTILMLVCGMVLCSGLPYGEAEQRMMGESLGRSGSPTQHRALLATPMVYTTGSSDSLGPRNWNEQRGQGAKHQPETNYLHPLYHGPTVGSGSGGLAVKNGLTTGYPHDGISCNIPNTTASQKAYDTNRPWYHTFPKGYTLQFVPFYAAEYTGYHWAVYDQTKRFYSYDDGDVTAGKRLGVTDAGDYDYEDSQELPAGCLLEYSDEQPSDAASPDAAVADAASPVQAASPSAQFIRGSEIAQMADHSAPAPFLRTTFGNATEASAARIAMLESTTTGRHGLARMLCKPIGAARDITWHRSEIICWSVIPSSIVLIIIAVCIIVALCNRQSQVQK